MNKIKKKHYLSLIFPIQLIYVKKLFKKFCYNFICLIINHDFCVIAFWMHYTLSLLSLEEIKLIGIVNWIIHVLDFFKYGLILLRYSLTDRVLYVTATFLFNIIVTAFTAHYTLTSSKDNNEECVMHSKSDNISLLILDTYCIQYPHTLPFLDLF